MNKKGQAAMEFVLVVIGALAYFGILNPNTLLPEKCQVQMGLNCKDHLVTSPSGVGKILMTLENGRGTDIKIVSINATTGTFGGSVSCNFSSPTPELLRNGASHSFELTGTPPGSKCLIPVEYAGSNTKAKWDVEIEWYSVASSSDYTHTASGELMAIVE